MSLTGTHRTLAETLSSIHCPVDSDEALRTQYAEFLPIPPEETPPPTPKRSHLATRPKKGPGSADPNRIRQPNEFNPERDEQAFIDAEAAGSLLHNNARPPVTIQRERAEHRFLIFLYAQGMSTKDIYIQLGGVWDSSTNLPVSGSGQYSYQHLHTIRRQAWFQTKLVSYMEECGKDLIRARFEAELMPSIDKVIAIRDDHKAPQQLQLRAAESLIDRFLGKPVQQVVTMPAASVERYEQTAESLVKETDLIESELKNLNAAFLDE